MYVTERRGVLLCVSLARRAEQFGLALIFGRHPLHQGKGWNTDAMKFICKSKEATMRYRVKAGMTGENYWIVNRLKLVD